MKFSTWFGALSGKNTISMSPSLVLITALGAFPAAPSAACNIIAPERQAVIASRQIPNPKRSFRPDIHALLMNRRAVISYHAQPAFTGGLRVVLALLRTVPLLFRYVPFPGPLLHH